MLTTLTDARGTVRSIDRRDGAPHEVRVEFEEGGKLGFVAVHFGLHYLRGNHAPYFTLTCDGRIGGSSFGGADHELIVRELPELADLAALHLSDLDGVPMHAEANGFYHLAAACGGLGQRFVSTDKEPLAVFAKHCRITIAEAESIRDDVLGQEVEDVRSLLPWTHRVHGAAARARWRAICESFRPRWKREADAAIEKYGLTVFGEAWRQAS